MDEMKTDDLLNEAVNETVAEKPTLTQRIEAFVPAIAQKFIEKKLDAFPYYCEVFRVQNQIRIENEKKDGSLGWSENKDFKRDYDIPTDLYYFMVNLVYRNFWEENNEKVWRPFLNALMRGDEPMSCLMKVKAIYGSTQDSEKAGIL